MTLAPSFRKCSRKVATLRPGVGGVRGDKVAGGASPASDIPPPLSSSHPETCSPRKFRATGSADLHAVVQFLDPVLDVAPLDSKSSRKSTADSV